MKKKDKLKPSKKTKPRSFRHLPAPLRQRTRIIGALKYDRRRRHEDAIFEILRSCLLRSLDKAQITQEDVKPFFNKNGISGGQFCQDCTECWYTKPKAGDRVHEVLRLAGYERHIDDHWLSVYGRVKPSIATATVAPPEARKAFGDRPYWIPHDAWVLPSGQTRKPGSHRS